MTGDEHYAEAEKLIKLSGKWAADADECRQRGDLACVRARDVTAGRQHDREARASERQASRCRELALIHATLAVAGKDNR